MLLRPAPVAAPVVPPRGRGPARPLARRLAPAAAVAVARGRCVCRGLADFRAPQATDLKVPVIPFPEAELLLPGRRKRMHLFEPRWVSMVDFALESCHGIFGMLYVNEAADLSPVISLVEIQSCSNLESQGRVVRVRGVSRAQLKGLTKEVATLTDWGLALVAELPEASEADGDASGAALSELCGQLDVGDEVEAEGSGPEGRGAQGSELWTHEKEALADVRGLKERWPRLLSEVQEALEGVPLCGVTEQHKAVAVLYAAMSQLDLARRRELFQSSEPLSRRLELVHSELSEQQGMARARRALQNVFDD